MSSTQYGQAESKPRDTIFALASAQGKAGVSVIRISGREALAALCTITGRASFTPRHAHMVTFKAAGQPIDSGLALWFPAPASFTGEEVVECHVHGSVAVVRSLLRALGALPGLRPAEAGEFTRRAFAHGKMDLLEAEGLADLIDAQTQQQQLQALRQMQGQMSKTYEGLRTRIIESLALLEAYIDFPDEDVPESVLEAQAASVLALRGIIASLLDDGQRGQCLREGISIVILGAPNAGKSSLLNAIARRDVAIVSHRPGTTRDMVEVHTDMAGYPVVFVDTAGIRDSDDEIEQEGIRRALARAADADLRLVVLDGGQWPQLDPASRELLDERTIAVVSKCDLRAHPEATADGLEAFFVSATTGEGMEALLEAISSRVVERFSAAEGTVITRERHRSQLQSAAESLDKSMAKKDLELRCEELRQAALAVGKITGKIQVDDVLDVVFKRFCIGK